MNRLHLIILLFLKAQAEGAELDHFIILLSFIFRPKHSHPTKSYIPVLLASMYSPGPVIKVQVKTGKIAIFR